MKTYADASFLVSLYGPDANFRGGGARRDRFHGGKIREALRYAAEAVRERELQVTGGS